MLTELRRKSVPKELPADMQAAADRDCMPVALAVLPAGGFFGG